MQTLPRQHKQEGNTMLDSVDHSDAFKAMLDGLGPDKDHFFLAPMPHLAAAGIPMLPTAVTNGIAMPMVAATATATAATGEELTVETHWYGITFTMNEKLTQDIINGTTAGGVLSGLVVSALGLAGVMTGGIATVIGGIVATVFAAKIAEMKIIDNGNGLYWPITWPQWAILLASVAGGPTTMLAAAMIALHPLRN
jgi:hypothetical protein